MLDFNITPSKYKAAAFYSNIKPEVIYAMQALTQSLGSNAQLSNVNTEPQSEAVESPNDDVGSMQGGPQ